MPSTPSVATRATDRGPRDLRGGWLALADGSLGALGVLAGAILFIGVPDRSTSWACESSLITSASAAGIRYLTASLVLVAADEAAAVAFLVAAAVIFRERRRSVLAVVLVAAFVARAVSYATGLETLAQRAPDWAGSIAVLRAVDGVLALLIVLIFPDGRFASRLSMCVFVAWSASVLGALALPGFDPVSQFGRDAWATAVVSAVALYSCAALIHRYRLAQNSDERARMTWLMCGLAVYAAVFTVQQLAATLVVTITEAGTAARFWYVLLSAVIGDAAASLVALTIAVALIRPDVLDIDRMVTRRLRTAL